MARSKAYLYRWHRDPLALRHRRMLAAGCRHAAPKRSFRFPGGLKDYLAQDIEGKELVTDQAFTGKVEKPGGHGSLEWAIAWFAGDDGFVHSYCNTIPTPDGGTHENRPQARRF